MWHICRITCLIFLASPDTAEPGRVTILKWIFLDTKKLTVEGQRKSHTAYVNRLSDPLYESAWIRQKISRHTNNRPETRRHILYNLRWAIKAWIKTLYRFAVDRQLSCLTPLVLFARKFANNWLLHLTTKKSLHACSVYQSHCTECHRQKI
jgi:hypothetical protein